MVTPNIKPGSDEELAIKRFVALWTNFAKFNDPNSYENNSVIDVNWNPVTKSDVNFLDIGKKLTVGSNPEANRMVFWKNVLNVNLVFDERV